MSQVLVLFLLLVSYKVAHVLPSYFRLLQMLRAGYLGVPQQFFSAFQYDVAWVKCFIHEFKNVLIKPNFVRLTFDILQAIHVTLTHAAMVVSVLLIVCQGLHAFVQSASLERLATFVSNSY